MRKMEMEREKKSPIILQTYFASIVCSETGFDRTIPYFSAMLVTILYVQQKHKIQKNTTAAVGSYLSALNV
jgi:hypothetical protein